MDLPKDLKNEIWEYCRVNGITNIDEFIVKMVTQGFTVEKFGATPYTKEPETIVKTVEVEVPVEKEVYVTDDSKVQELLEKLHNLQRTYDEAIVKESGSQSEIDKLKDEIATLRKQKAEDNDIYREDRKGLYGSNTKDIYGK
jgi:hypothetical protein